MEIVVKIEMAKYFQMVASTTDSRYPENLDYTSTHKTDDLTPFKSCRGKDHYTRGHFACIEMSS